MAFGIGVTQERRFSSQPISISGRRILTAANSAALPTALKIIAGSLPTGYTDLGSMVAGKVDVSVTINKQSIDLGRIPSPHRFFIASQSGQVKAQMQEYQPEMIDTQAGGTGTVATAAGYSYVYIGGRLGSLRRILIFDDFDVDFANDGFGWDQYWWTNPTAQAGGSFTLTDDKLATVIPVEFELLAFAISGINRLLQFVGIPHS